MARVSKTGESKVRFSKSEKITFFRFYTFFWVSPNDAGWAVLRFWVQNVFTCFGDFERVWSGLTQKDFPICRSFCIFSIKKCFEIAMKTVCDFSKTPKSVQKHENLHIPPKLTRRGHQFIIFCHFVTLSGSFSGLISPLVTLGRLVTSLKLRPNRSK